MCWLRYNNDHGHDGMIMRSCDFPWRPCHDHAIFHNDHDMIWPWSYHGDYESPWSYMSYHDRHVWPWLSTRAIRGHKFQSFETILSFIEKTEVKWLQSLCSKVTKLKFLNYTAPHVYLSHVFNSSRTKFECWGWVMRKAFKILWTKDLIFYTRGVLTIAVTTLLTGFY